MFIVKTVEVLESLESIFRHTLKAPFIRRSSEYETSDSDRKAIPNTKPDAVTRDRMRQIDPYSGGLGLIHHCLLEES